MLLAAEIQSPISADQLLIFLVQFAVLLGTALLLGRLALRLGLGVAVGFLLPGALVAAGTERLVFALFLGVALCLSAIPVIAKTLLEMRLLHRNIGQLIVSAAAVDDIAGWLLLSIVSALATTGLRAGNVAVSVGCLVAVVVFTVVVGRPLVRVALRLAGRSREQGVDVAVVVVLLLFAAAGTQALGLEAILGTFLCGILIGSSGVVDRERLTGLHTFVMAVLAPIFFATAGLRMDLTALVRPAVLGAALLVVAVAIVGKFAGAYLGGRLGRLGHWESLALGAGMNARGVVEIVVAMVGLRLGVLGPAAYTIIVLVAIVTSLMAPPTLRYAVGRIEVTTEELARQKVFST